MTNSHKSYLVALSWLFFSAMGMAQNVGIGTNAPSEKLHVYQTTGNSTVAVQSIQNTSFSSLQLVTGSSTSDLLRYGSNTGSTIAGINANNATRLWSGDGRMIIGTGSANNLHFVTAATERMVINGTGQVGIGVTNPIGILEADAGTLSETSIRWKSSSGNGVRQWFMMGNDLTTALVIARFGSDLGGNTFDLSNQHLSAIYTNDLGVNALAIGTKNSIPLVLGTNNRERARISGNGNMGINQPNPDYKLHVEGGNNTAIYARTTSNATDSSAIRGVLDNAAAGGRAAGVRGISTSATSYGIGVYGTNNGGGWGVAGSVKEAGTLGLGAGVFGEAGLHGVPSGTGGFGVYGINSNPDGTAGFFRDVYSNGKALMTQGAIRFLGINESTGNVLTSDQFGNATWQPLPIGASVWSTQGGNNIYNNNSGYVGINTPPALPNFAQLVVQRGAGADIGVLAEMGATLSINQNLNLGSGLYGISMAPKNGAAGYAGITGLNISTQSDRLGVAGISQGISSGAAISAGVGGYGDYGVLGYSQTANGAGMIAQHAAGKTALELNNGFLKVTGSNKTAFKHTTGVGNISSNYSYLTYATPSENDIVIVTHNYSPNGTYLNKAVGVFWEAGNSRWCIYNEDLSNMPTNITFNVLVIKQ
jgi:hypothetical protein